MRGAALAAALWCAFALGPAAAQSESGPPLQGLRWLAPGAGVEALTQAPRPYLAGGGASVLVRLGELAFRAPRVLGGEARLSGLSCQTCHPNGDAATRFFVDRLSDRPGNVDVTHRLFNPMHDDGNANPINIPSLRGVAATAPYGRDGRISSLREFTRQVIVTEFEGHEPAGWLLDALVAYQQKLAFLPGANIGPGGRLTAGAGAAARRGEQLFLRPFPRQGELSCAGCHAPAGLFLDGRRHDVGSGGIFDTPTLLNAGHTAPYFHDGRHASFDDVVAHYGRTFGLELTGADRRDLVAYLEAVGGADTPKVSVRFYDDFQKLREFISIVDYVAEAEDARVGAFAAEAIRFELGRLYQRFPHPGGAGVRQLFVALSKTLHRMVPLFEDGGFIAARRAVAVLRGQLDSLTPTEILAAEAASLYAPERLDGALKRR